LVEIVSVVDQVDHHIIDLAICVPVLLVQVGLVIVVFLMLFQVDLVTLLVACQDFAKMVLVVLSRNVDRIMEWM
jgi:hypothetical protein